MATYKITNITNLAGKRDFKYNSNLDIEYIDDMKKNVLTIKPGNTVYLTISSLPSSVHKLRVRKLITVVEIGAEELIKSMNDAKPKNNNTSNIVEKEIFDDDIETEGESEETGHKKSGKGRKKS